MQPRFALPLAGSAIPPGTARATASSAHGYLASSFGMPGPPIGPKALPAGVHCPVWVPKGLPAPEPDPDNYAIGHCPAGMVMAYVWRAVAVPLLLRLGSGGACK